MLVFISYAHADAAFADKLVADLQKRAIPIWYDKFSIQPGQRWDRAVQSGLDGASHVIYIMSTTSVASDNCLDEVDSALTANKPVYPILLEECNRPLRVRRIQYTDFRGSYDAKLAELLSILGPAPAQPQAQGPAKQAMNTTQVSALGATSTALRVAKAATPTDLVAQIGQQLSRSGESYEAAQQALIALAQVAPASSQSKAWRDVAFDAQTDTALAQVIVESSDEQITRDVAQLIAELRSSKAVAWLAGQAAQHNQRAMQGLALIRGEAGSLPPEIAPDIRRSAFWQIVSQQLLARPAQIIFRYSANSLGFGISLAVIIYATFNGSPADALRSGLGLGSLVGSLIGLVGTLTIQIGQSLDIASTRARMLIAGLLGTILALLVFIWIQLFIYSGQGLSPLLLLWALLFVAGYALSPLFSGTTLGGILLKIGFAALGIFAALYLSARSSPISSVIFVGSADQQLILSAFAAVLTATASFLPDLMAYVAEQRRRAVRVVPHNSTQPSRESKP